MSTKILWEEGKESCEAAKNSKSSLLEAAKVVFPHNIVEPYDSLKRKVVSEPSTWYELSKHGELWNRHL